jgi:hypothetical protein
MNQIISFSYNSKGEPTVVLLGALKGELWAPTLSFSCITGEIGEIRPFSSQITPGTEYFECDDNDQERILYWLKHKKPEIYMKLLTIIWDDPITMLFHG